MCDQCPFSEDIAELERKDPSSATAVVVANPETEEVEECSHWQVVDKKTKRSYLGSRSFTTRLEAEMMLNDLLRYHQHTEWAERLVVMPGRKLKKRETVFDPNAQNLLGRPKGCKGKATKSRFKPTGIEWGIHTRYR